METVNAFFADLRAGPTWVYWWVMFMGLAFMPAFIFALSRQEARWTVLAMLATFPAMMWLYAQVGYVRLLGLPHVIFWTPLLVYLWTRRRRWRVRDTLAGKWIAVLVATILISLAFDCADVIRYIAGDRT